MAIMKTNVHGFSTLLLVLALAVTPPLASAQNAPALASSLLQQNVNFSQTFAVDGQQAFNSCYTPTQAQLAANASCGLDPLGSGLTGELVALSGTVTSAYHFEQDAKGSWHMKTVVHKELTGVGQCSGAKYVDKDDSNSDLSLKLNNDGSPNKSDTMFTDKDKLISQGPLPNLTLTYKYHVVVDENGNVKFFPHADGATVTKCSK
jgi:hypothetical protein